MPHLSLRLLGSFRVTLDDRPVIGFESDKVRALLAYLAVESDRPHRREALVGLLWPDWPESSARQNLSQALYNLRTVIGDREVEPPFLLVTPQTLQFNRESDHSLDTAALTDRPAVATVDELEAAAEVCRGTFLTGFSIPDCAAFEEWITATR
jgi:DNA-binding SARP family transcriptional activator